VKRDDVFVTTTENLIQSFQVGHLVSATSVCDHECVWTFEVVARTAKFVTLRNVRTDETYRVGVKVSDGEEWTLPFGSYSMAPIVRAAVR